jgi:protein subunit release factor B
VTAGAQFPVSADKVRELREKLAALGIRDEDLDEQFVRSGGKGGQNVNKVATCVVLLHRPSGIQVKCQQERSQGMNRYYARKLLCEKLEAERLGRASAREQAIEKLRRQKRRRSRRARNKMLADKHARSEVKQGRASVKHDD